MCTKAEVREIMKDAVVPAWARAVMSSAILGSIMLLAWLSITTYEQTVVIQDLKSSSILNDAKITGRIEILLAELENVKELTIAKSNDMYTETQALARGTLVDERCSSMKKEHESMTIRCNRLSERISQLEEQSRK